MRRRPALVRRQAEAEQQAGEGGRSQREAFDVELRLLDDRRFLEQQSSREDVDDADRQVNQEDEAPAHILDDEAAEGWSKDRRNEVGQAEDGDVLWALHRRDQREDQR